MKVRILEHVSRRDSVNDASCTATAVATISAVDGSAFNSSHKHPRIKSSWLRDNFDRAAARGAGTSGACVSPSRSFPVRDFGDFDEGSSKSGRRVPKGKWINQVRGW